jgi:hypothetical protein
MAIAVAAGARVFTFYLHPPFKLSVVFIQKAGAKQSIKGGKMSQVSEKGYDQIINVCSLQGENLRKELAVFQHRLSPCSQLILIQII